MILSHRIENNICIVELRNDLILDKVYELPSEISAILNKVTPAALVINLKHVTHIDSAGWGALITLSKKTKLPKGVAICQFSNDILGIPFQAKFSKIIPTFQTEQEAIAFMHTQ
ncbi:MAG: STAS domain-containing protein [SAR324 cluster bacterium]|nr:STAS domain-containing protein [SAR324 cluster bacterium]